MKWHYTLMRLFLQLFFGFVLLIFIWLCRVIISACGIYFPDQGLNQVSLQWECGVLAKGPPRKSLNQVIKYCFSVKNSRCAQAVMTCLYLHFCLLDLLNLSILSLVSAITLISPVITRMLGSTGELSNRQQCSPNRIINFRKVLDGRYYCWASGGLWLQHWTALGGTWAATACMYNLMFLLLCGFHISISGNCKPCV